jgi:hypothetical protein
MSSDNDTDQLELGAGEKQFSQTQALVTIRE